ASGSANTSVPPTWCANGVSASMQGRGLRSVRSRTESGRGMFHDSCPPTAVPHHAVAHGNSLALLGVARRTPGGRSLLRRSLRRCAASTWKARRYERDRRGGVERGGRTAPGALSDRLPPRAAGRAAV